MKYVASWSGGKDSTATIILAHLNDEPLDEIVMSEVMFDNNRGISGELPEHMKFVKEVATPLFESWGYKVTLLHSKYDYLHFFYETRRGGKWQGKKYGFPIGGKCWANGRLKIQPIKDYFKEHETIQYVGIAIDEPKRLARLKDNCISLLAKYNFTEQMAYELCKEYNLLNPIYEFTKRGGCWFCPNQRIYQFARVKKYYPQLWEELNILSKEENKCCEGFAYGNTFHQVDYEVDKYLYMQENQLSIWSDNE